jgi:hypothetical protein
MNGASGNWNHGASKEQLRCNQYLPVDVKVVEHHISVDGPEGSAYTQHHMHTPIRHVIPIFHIYWLGRIPRHYNHHCPLPLRGTVHTPACYNRYPSTDIDYGTVCQEEYALKRLAKINTAKHDSVTTSSFSQRLDTS